MDQTPKEIISAHNPLFIHCKELSINKKYRYTHKQYIAEGVRAFDRTADITSVLVRKGTALPVSLKKQPYSMVAEKLFERLADTEQSQGIIACCKMNLQAVNTLEQDKRYVLIDHLQDPGNIGTIIRTADAFGYEGIIVTDGCADPYNPKAVRSSMGSISSLPVIPLTSTHELKGYTLMAADKSGIPFTKVAWPTGYILVIGSEAHGVSNELLTRASHTISIPIAPGVDSLNAAIAAGILMAQSVAKK